jgi:hypothetical protein
VTAEAVPAEHHTVKLAVQPVRVAADAAVVPIIDRIDGMNQRAIYPGAQFMIRTAATQHLDFHAVPGIGRYFRAAEPLAHGRRNIIARDFIGAQMTFDLAETDFVIGIRSRLQTHDMFMIVTGFITQLLAHEYHGPHMHFADARRQRTHDLRRVGTALEVHRIGTAERARVIHQREFAHAAVVIGVVINPCDEIIPSRRLLIDRTGLKTVIEEAATRGGA